MTQSKTYYFHCRYCGLRTPSGYEEPTKPGCCRSCAAARHAAEEAATAVTVVELEDRGQDFTEFYVDGAGLIVDARPFQSWLWSGCRIKEKHIKRGDRLTLIGKDGKQMHPLIYPVRKVRQLKEAAP